MIDRIRSFIEDESGATAIEYGLIGALVTVAGVVALKGFGSAFADVFTTADTAIGG